MCSPKLLLEASEIRVDLSVPLSFKGNDRESPKKGGGKRIVGGGSKNVFGEGFFAEFTVCFPPPEFSIPLGRSLKIGGQSKTKTKTEEGQEERGIARIKFTEKSDT